VKNVPEFAAYLFLGTAVDSSNRNPLDDVSRYLSPTPVVEAGGSRVGVTG